MGQFAMWRKDGIGFSWKTPARASHAPAVRAATARALGEIGNPCAAKLLIPALQDAVLSVRENAVRALWKIIPRGILFYLNEKEFLFVDVLHKHIEDFKVFNCSPEEYARRYYIGHYNPRGNHFFAFAVKDDIVKWLEPKPPTYREKGPSLQTLAATLA